MGCAVIGYKAGDHTINKNYSIKKTQKYNEDVVDRWFEDHDDFRGKPNYDTKSARRIIDMRLGCDANTSRKERTQKVIDAIIGAVVGTRYFRFCSFALLVEFVHG